MPPFLARLPTWLDRAIARLPRVAAVRSGRSAIHGAGLFVRRRIAAGGCIGAVGLGPVCEQGRHTLLVGAEHREVHAPWCFMNHACVPTATLALSDRDAMLFAARELAPGTELTIDYTLLPEKISTPFACQCQRCSASAAPHSLGG